MLGTKGRLKNMKLLIIIRNSLLVLFALALAIFGIWLFVSFVDVIAHNTTPGGDSWLGVLNFFEVYLNLGSML